MLTDEKGYFLEFGDDPEIAAFVSPMVRLRAGIVLDPLVAEDWVCDPVRCRPAMGRNLCCKVDIRCVHLQDGICAIHASKPFSCALFPLDLWRVGGLRVVVSGKNPVPYARDWSRFDRDMLRCFSGEIPKGPSMLEVQLPVLERVFTRGELTMMMAAVERLRDESS